MKFRLLGPVEVWSETAVRHDAVDRLLNFYLRATARATEHYEVIGLRNGLDLANATAMSIPPLDTWQQAETWLDTEWLNVIAIIKLADELRLHDYTWRLTRALWAHLWRHGHNVESADIHERALIAVQRLKHDVDEAIIRNYLASAYFRLGRPLDAIEQLEQALQIHNSLSEGAARAIALGNLGVVYRFVGRLEQALDVIQKGVSSAGINSRWRIWRTDDIVIIYIRLGCYTEALTLSRRNLADARLANYAYGQALALSTIGAIHDRLGHHWLAATLLQRALDMKRNAGGGVGEAESLSDLGSAHRSLGQHSEALRDQHEALDCARKLSEPGVEAKILNELAQTWQASGNLIEASKLYREALQLAERVHEQYELARSHDGLGAVLRDKDPAGAYKHWRRALTLYTEMGVPDRFEVERNLAELDAG
jgi:tetratricopeptide (TPR) repeat protein